MEAFETVELSTDLLIVGGGMAACGAAWEASYWAKKNNLSVLMVDKAAVDRSGAVAMGLSAINTYIGAGKGENSCEDFVSYVQNDQMGTVREDLVYDIARHVDSSVHLFEKWGLPIWKDAEGNYQRAGRWQIMINGESYKVIVAEAAKNELGVDNILERIFIVKLFTDANDPSRIAGAGVGLADQLLERTNEVNLFSFDFGTLALLFVAALVLGLSFILIALQVFILLIEFKLVTLGGFILIPFALLDRTTSMAQGALGYVISAGLKVFVIAVVVSFALAFVEGITLSEEEPNVSEAFTAIGVSLTFLMLAIRAPGLAASMVSGGPQLGVGAIAQTAATAVGAGTAAAFGTAATFRAAGAVGTLTARAQQHLQGRICLNLVSAAFINLFQSGP